MRGCWAGGDDMGQVGREKTQADSLGHVLGWARSMPGAGVEAGRWNGREERDWLSRQRRWDLRWRGSDVQLRKWSEGHFPSPSTRWRDHLWGSGARG